jgi:hypothetical protein
MHANPAPRLLLAGLLALLAASVQAANGEVVGRVITQTGEVAAVGPDGERRGLGRRDPVYEGDTLVTGDPGRAQIRFKDDGLTDLRPGSRFQVAEYRAGQATGDEDKSVVMRLIKGGMRTVTGAVGRDNKDRYRMETPVANIGIRGTQYQLNYCQSQCGGGAPGLYGGVTRGGVEVANQGGEAAFGQGQYFYVASASQSPEGLLTPPPGVLDRPGGSAGDGEQEASADGEAGGGEDAEPLSAGPALDDSDYQVGEAATEGLQETAEEQQDKTGDTAQDWNIDAVEGSPDAWGGAYPDVSTTFGLAGNQTEAVSVDSQGVVRSMTLKTAYDNTVTFQVDANAEPAETGNAFDGAVYWGRWQESDVSKTTSPSGIGEHTGDFHYVYADDLTTPTEFSQLSGTATYAWAGGTKPQGSSGTAYAVDQFTLQVDFGTAELTQGTLKLTATSDGANDVSYELSSQLLDGPRFSTTPQGENWGKVKGRLLGQDAEGVMVMYNLWGNSAYINGAGALEKQ